MFSLVSRRAELGCSYSKPTARAADSMRKVCHNNGHDDNAH